MSMTEIWMPSPHYSTSRGPYNKVVLHTTEGAMKIRDLGAWFANPSAQCSSHFGADNYEPGVVGAYVYESHKAWTQGNANPYCLSMELCAYASWSRDTWLNSKGVLLQNAADWVAWMCGKYNVPIRSLTASEAQDPNVRGVCDHVDFGSWGGGHWDCGSGFPMDKVIEWAKGGSSSAQPVGSTFMSSSVAYLSNGQPVYACVWNDGKVNVKFGDGGTWAACDSSQSPVKSGATISARPDGGLIVVFTNQSGDVCAYERGPDGGKWMWKNLKGDAK